MVVDPPGRAEPRHLLAALERLNVRLGDGMGRRLAEAGLQLRGSEGRILQLLPPGGARPTDLAHGSWISKQAMAKRVQGLQARGLVRCEPDPADGRAVLVLLTRAGEEARDAVAACIADLERELEAALGPDRWASFRAALDRLGAPPPG